MLEAYTTLGYLAALHLPGQAAHPGHRRRLPAPGRARQDRHHARRAVRRPGLARHRRGLERGGVARARHPVPAGRRAVRAAGGDAADLPADVARRRDPVPGPALPAGAAAELAAGADPAAPADHDRRRRASGRRCGWWPATPRPATCSPAPTSARKLDVLRAHCEAEGRDYDDDHQDLLLHLRRRARRARRPARSSTSSARSPELGFQAAIGAVTGRLGRHPAGDHRQRGDPRRRQPVSPGRRGLHPGMPYGASTGTRTPSVLSRCAISPASVVTTAASAWAAVIATRPSTTSDVPAPASSVPTGVT